jgi:hypothetical protein
MIQKDMIFLGQWVVKSIFLVSLLAPAYPPHYKSGMKSYQNS